MTTNLDAVIYVAEDDEGLNRLLCKILRRNELNVRSFCNGAELIDALREELPTLLICDYDLGDMTFSDIMSTVPGIIKEVQFVIMTGKSDVQLAVELMKKGAREYLLKDDSLMTSISAVIERNLTQIERDRRLEQAEADLQIFSEQQVVLLREVNHRIKNNLVAMCSLVSMEEERLNDCSVDNVKGLLQNVRSRIEALSTVHNLLSYNRWEPLNLLVLCHDILTSVFTASTLVSVNLSTNGDKVMVSSDHAHNLALVLNELATNTYKYASINNGDILVTVDVKFTDNIVSLRYADNGNGFPKSILDKEYAQGVGMTLINGITEHSLQGEVILENANGACTTLIFPLETGSLKINQAALQPTQNDNTIADELPLPITFPQCKRLFEELPYGFSLKDTSGVYLWCNRKYSADLGHANDQVVGKTDYDLFPLEQAEDIRRDDRKIISNRYTKEALETYLLNNKVHHIQVTKAAIYDEKNMVMGVLGVSKDVTEVRQSIHNSFVTQKEMEQQKDFAETIFKLAPIAVFAVDINKKITMWNLEAERLTGYCAEDAIGQHCSFFSLSPCTESCSLYGEHTKKPVVGRICTIRRKDGIELTLIKNADIIHDLTGEIIGGIECLIDISAYK